MTATSLQTLQQIWGYDQFRGQQAEIVETVVNGGDALVLMPTGGGKSLCYQVPSIIRPGVGLVVSPLIALMQDQVVTLKQLGVSAAYLNSTLSSQEQYQVEAQVQNGELDLLYVAPERLLQPRTLEMLSRCQIALIAIDEAHCVSQWGHDFRPDYILLSQLVERFPKVPRIALTATADIPTREEIAQRLRLENASHYVHSFDRPNICYRVAERGSGRGQLLEFIKNEHPEDAGIVYCLSRKKVEQTAEWLRSSGFDALPYHAGLDHNVREQNQRQFLDNDSTIIVATVAFGMGIDKPNVRFVAHLDMPSSVEAYYQETGRAGRDGTPSDAWMLYGLNDVVQRRQMIERSPSLEERKRVERHKLDGMLAYCELSSCRRENLLGYFGQDSAACGNCDTCTNPPETWDATLAAQKLLSAIYRTGQRFGAQYLIDHLGGKSSDRSKQFGHNKLTTFGIGSEIDDKQWRGLLRQLVASNLITVDYASFGSLKLNDKSRPVLRGENPLLLRKIREKQRVSKKSQVNRNGLTGADENLWESLRSLRQRLAKDQNVPPYVIFHDATLMQMVETKPATSSAFVSISGVSEKKLASYGEAFMSAIKQAARPTAEHNDLSDSAVETVSLFSDGAGIEDLAHTRSLSISTVWGHLANGIAAGELKVADVVPLEAVEISQIEAELVNNQNADGQFKLKPVYEYFGEQYGYEILRCVSAGINC
ncbi:MAG: ATP-dependent DNA helicase RecQ [Gammaproteobacteria bacterium]|jgi:ATP-dependent DNA helicase RecQ